jgi:hypothetical protein
MRLIDASTDEEDPMTLMMLRMVTKVFAYCLVFWVVSVVVMNLL